MSGGTAAKNSLSDVESICNEVLKLRVLWYNKTEKARHKHVGEILKMCEAAIEKERGNDSTG